MADQSRLTWALVLSVLLHGLLLSLLPILRRAHIELPAPPALVDVDVVSLPKAQAKPAANAPALAAPAMPPLAVPKQQIVSPPDAGEEKEPENPRFLSDRNNTVKEETIHHGEPVAGNPEAKHPEPPQRAADAKPERSQPVAKAELERPRPNVRAALPRLDQLLPDAGDLIREGIVKPQEVPAQNAPQQQASIKDGSSKERNDLLRHGDPWKRSGLGGTMDYLPAVRDGDVTMLNTKADQFAPFVRRVAVRVFENFVIFLRRSSDNGQTASEESAVVEAIMDKTGRVVAINLKEHSFSGALGTDQSLQAAVHEGFFDRNPPSGAESSDGKIHFVFETRVVTAVDQRGRRVPTWALLGAGLL
jgi:hypothetical protein